MSAGAALVIVAVVATMTYAMRASAIVALANRSIGHQVERVLRMVGPAVLAALAINLAAGGQDAPNLDLAEVAGLVVGGVVARWRRSLIWSVLAGMAALWIVSGVS